MTALILREEATRLLLIHPSWLREPTRASLACSRWTLLYPRAVVPNLRRFQFVFRILQIVIRSVQSSSRLPGTLNAIPARL